MVCQVLASHIQRTFVLCLKFLLILKKEISTIFFTFFFFSCQPITHIRHIRDLETIPDEIR